MGMSGHPLGKDSLRISARGGRVMVVASCGERYRFTTLSVVEQTIASLTEALEKAREYEDLMKQREAASEVVYPSGEMLTAE